MRLLRRLLIWLIIAALPLQGWAAAGMLNCGAMRQAVAHSTHDHSGVGDSGRAHDAGHSQHPGHVEHVDRARHAGHIEQAGHIEHAGDIEHAGHIEYAGHAENAGHVTHARNAAEGAGRAGHAAATVLVMNTDHAAAQPVADRLGLTQSGHTQCSACAVCAIAVGLINTNDSGAVVTGPAETLIAVITTADIEFIRDGLERPPRQLIA